MCDLCSAVPNERAVAIANIRWQAIQLRKLADKFDALARGDIQPHKEEARTIGILARSAIRYLVEEWL